MALASHLKALGHEVSMCVPPDFRNRIEGLGIRVTPMGPEVRSFAACRTAPTEPRKPLTAEQRRQMAESTVSTQFETLTSAAQDCDVIVAASALQVAARSVTEKTGIHYVFAAYAPVVLPSPDHAPPPLPGQAPRTTNDKTELWAQDAARFNDLFGAALNPRRASLGLAEISDVRNHMMTDQRWLAADATVGPWPDTADSRVFQTSAWILPDERPLSRDLETFLESGDRPIYFGFGSTRAFAEAGPVMLRAASRDPQSLRSALLGAASANVGHRCGARSWPTTRDSLSSALAQILQPEVAARVRAVAAAVRRDGTRVAAERLLALV